MKVVSNLEDNITVGKRFDIEVQRDNGGAHIRRARFHSSMVDV